MRNRSKHSRYLTACLPLCLLVAVLTGGCETTGENAAMGALLGTLAGAGPLDTPANRATALGMRAASAGFQAEAQRGVAAAGADRTNVNVNVGQNSTGGNAGSGQAGMAVDTWACSRWVNHNGDANAQRTECSGFKNSFSRSEGIIVGFETKGWPGGSISRRIKDDSGRCLFESDTQYASPSGGICWSWEFDPYTFDRKQSFRIEWVLDGRVLASETFHIIDQHPFYDRYLSEPFFYKGYNEDGEKWHGYFVGIKDVFSTNEEVRAASIWEVHNGDLNGKRVTIDVMGLDNQGLVQDFGIIEVDPDNVIRVNSGYNGTWATQYRLPLDALRAQVKGHRFRVIWKIDGEPMRTADFTLVDGE